VIDITPGQQTETRRNTTEKSWQQYLKAAVGRF